MRRKAVEDVVEHLRREYATAASHGCRDAWQAFHHWRREDDDDGSNGGRDGGTYNGIDDDGGSGDL